MVDYENNKAADRFHERRWISWELSGYEICTKTLVSFFCFPGVTTHCVCIFRSPVAGFSLLVFSRFLHHTQRRATVGRTPLDAWSIRRRDLYLTTHNTHNRQTSMPAVGFEPTISAGERPKTYALDRAAIGTGMFNSYYILNVLK